MKDEELVAQVIGNRLGHPLVHRHMALAGGKHLVRAVAVVETVPPAQVQVILPSKGGGSIVKLGGQWISGRRERKA